MKLLSFAVALFGVIALVLAQTAGDMWIAVLGATSLVCAYTTFRSTAISSFLKIFVGIFSIETILFGLAALASRAGLWIAAYADYMVPDSLPLTVAIFSIIVYLVSQLDTVRQITRIADRYFDADEPGLPASGHCRRLRHWSGASPPPWWFSSWC